jgi:hypothetical protein
VSYTEVSIRVLPGLASQKLVECGIAGLEGPPVVIRPEKLNNRHRSPI